MKPFDVYPLMDIEPVKALGSHILDKNGEKYLDFYGGHAVVSIGHSHPAFVAAIKKQVESLAFYSNSVQSALREEAAERVGKLSGYEDYRVFFCNSGAEANENALKVASFHNGRKKVIAFTGGFHGRTSGAVAATDNPDIVSPYNRSENVTILPFDDIDSIEKKLDDSIAAVIVEGIQGIAGVYIPQPEFLVKLSALCERHGITLILDEVQSGNGRTGLFFAHRHAGIKPDIVTVAKGMGNGFPVGGVLIHPKFKARHGLLGSTFGGGHLACAAINSVMKVIEEENLMENAERTGTYLIRRLKEVPNIREVRGKGLMVGIELPESAHAVRQRLLVKHKILTGAARNKNTVRLLPPLSIGKSEADTLIEALEEELTKAE